MICGTKVQWFPHGTRRQEVCLIPNPFVVTYLLPILLFISRNISNNQNKHNMRKTIKPKHSNKIDCFGFSFLLYCNTE